MSAFQAPTGTRDVLAPESSRFESLVARFARLAELAGYGLVVSPMFEDVALFSRGVGEATDVVTKEMYVFEDKGGRTIALRPEGTAPVVRAFVQHRPVLPWKAWYATPCFRYERPQAGRYRQFHQLGVEALGPQDADLDVEVVALFEGLRRSLGLEGVELRVNSMGDAACLPGYRAVLASYLSDHGEELCADHRTSWSRNPLRVLDCKKQACVSVRAGAPLLRDALCDACEAHFDRFLSGLGSLGIRWTRDDFLVRGLDYYTRTTFEFRASGLDAAQDTICGGGRYNGLVEELGGPPTPGIGFAAGVERILLACAVEGVELAPERATEVFVVDVVGGGSARDLTDALRRAGVAADRAFDGRSLKSQLKQADRSGARVACIVGPEEEAAGVVTVRWMRESGAGGPGPGRQERVARGDLVEAVARWTR
ncbi:MAG: histidine--tRNA ligase [Actinomycetota bacterium]|nr:histidine--tRNA ligase [Actinomycetota bacterium]